MWVTLNVLCWEWCYSMLTRCESAAVDWRWYNETLMNWCDCHSVSSAVTSSVTLMNWCDCHSVSSAVTSSVTLMNWCDCHSVSSAVTSSVITTCVTSTLSLQTLSHVPPVSLASSAVTTAVSSTSSYMSSSHDAVVEQARQVTSFDTSLSCSMWNNSTIATFIDRWHHLTLHCHVVCEITVQ